MSLLRLISYLDNGSNRVGAVTDDLVVNLGDRFDSAFDLIETLSPEELRSLAGRASPVARLEEVTLRTPIPEPRRNVFCVGWNYLPHFEEGNRDGHRELPDHPTFFTKATTTVIGPGEEIPLDKAFTEKLDYEAELAVVVGRGGKNIPAGEALDRVFGYTVANDISARDAQKRHGGQWFKGKSPDGGCPIGPWIVPSDEIPDPQGLSIQSHVNGVEKQSSSTRNMYFPVARIIEELSLGMTLLPGDIILTGTPEGVGVWREPPEFLGAGDEVTVSVSGIGELTNRVGEATSARPTPPTAREAREETHRVT